MHLKKVAVSNFRSVEQSEPFSIEQVTCLVGKNEAGKSAILQAIASLNPHPLTPFRLDKERDYPRRFLTDYATRHKDTEAVVVTTDWKITNTEKAEIEAIFGAGALDSEEVKISRRYGKDLEWQLPTNYKKIIAHLFKKHKLSGEDSEVLKGSDTTSNLIEALKALPARTPPQEALLAELSAFGSATKKITQLLNAHLPFFMYFSNYDRMDGAVQIDTLNQMKADGRIAKDEFKGTRLFDEFLTYAGAPVAEIVGVGTYETFNARLEAVSNNITDQILEYWTQNDLPPNFHPAAIRASASVTPFGAVSVPA
jgi:hypothetical protein